MMDNEPIFESGTIGGKPLTADQLAKANEVAEMKDLTARMAADEAGEGNYATAAELQAAADRANAEIQRLHGPVDDAPTGPLTPGQVRCRVCGLDDRTRAASSPDDMLCDVCRADTPNRVARERRSALESEAERFTGWANDGGDLARRRVDALMRIADLLRGHMVPEELVQAAEAGVRGQETNRG